MDLGVFAKDLEVGRTWKLDSEDGGCLKNVENI